MNDDALAREAVTRALAAGEACELYDGSASLVMGEDGRPERPVQILVRFAVGDRALAPEDPLAGTLRATELDMERLEVEQLRTEPSALDELERGGA